MGVTRNDIQAVTLGGNTAGAMTGVSTGTLTLAGGNNITLSQAGNAVTISGPTVGGAQTGISSVAASNTTYTSGGITFTGSNLATVRSTTEVGEAYEHALDLILGNDTLRSYRYLFTCEEDNLLPPDTLLRLIERMEEPYDAVSALYWTKGEGGVPQIWGDASDAVNFRPQPPRPGQVVECHGIGMGAALFDLEMFRSGRIERPFFKTQTSNGLMTQDLYFWSKARCAGFRCAVDCDIRVGHLDVNTGMVW